MQEITVTPTDKRSQHIARLREEHRARLEAEASAKEKEEMQIKEDEQKLKAKGLKAAEDMNKADFEEILKIGELEPRSSTRYIVENGNPKKDTYQEMKEEVRKILKEYDGPKPKNVNGHLLYKYHEVCAWFGGVIEYWNSIKDEVEAVIPNSE